MRGFSNVFSQKFGLNSVFILVVLSAFWLLTGCGEGEEERDGTADVSSGDDSVMVEDDDVDNDTSHDVVKDDGVVEVYYELPEDGVSDVPEGPENCPPPPYGTQVGDTIRPHEFISIDDRIISLCDFYQDTSVKLLLIYATAGWCAVCTQESRALPSYYNDYHDQGLEILAAVFEDENGNPATRTYAQNYAVAYGFRFPTVVDNTFQLGIYFDKAATPMNMFVDLTDMEILDIQLGFDYQYDSMRDDIEYYLFQIER